MKNFLKLPILALLCLSCSSWASHKGPNECSRLHIQIGNGSDSACQLISKTVIHGKLDSSPPAVILPGYSERFDISQTLYGPHIKLEYRCSGKRITFESQQNYCFLKAGKVRGSIVAADANVHASFMTENGSWYWDKPGLINWVLTA